METISLKKESIRSEIEASLGRLEIDVIDPSWRECPVEACSMAVDPGMNSGLLDFRHSELDFVAEIFGHVISLGIVSCCRAHPR